MLEIPEDRCERFRVFQAIDRAFKAGDFDGLARALGSSPGWFDELMPHEFGLGHPLEYAITGARSPWSKRCSRRVRT